MGIIKAVFSAMGGGLADSWQEVLEADNMGDNTVFTRGVKVRPNDRRNSNKKGTEDTISNGSIIHVYDNQFMLLVDGGKVVDFILKVYRFFGRTEWFRCHLIQVKSSQHLTLFRYYANSNNIALY